MAWPDWPWPPSDFTTDLRHCPARFFSRSIARPYATTEKQLLALTYRNPVTIFKHFQQNFPLLSFTALASSTPPASCRGALTRHWVLCLVTLTGFVSFSWVSCYRGLRAGSGVVRMDPLRFLAGCRTRRLNQAYSLSVISISMLYYCIAIY